LLPIVSSVGLWPFNIRHCFDAVKTSIFKESTGKASPKQVACNQAFSSMLLSMFH
jgi:hypothetical protein